DTLIETLTGTLHMTPAGTEIAALKMVTSSIGTLTGEGTITPTGALNFGMVAKLREGAIATPSAGLARVISYGQTSGVPFRIQGTTKNPQFAPDASRLVKDTLKDAVKSPDN